MQKVGQCLNDILVGLTEGSNYILQMLVHCCFHYQRSSVFYCEKAIVKDILFCEQF